MKHLSVVPAALCTGGRRLRRTQFEERSSLPVSAACVVASGARETLATIFGSSVAMRLFEPLIPSPNAWVEIAREALVYRVRGDLADAAIVLRPPDALALAGAAFGEEIDVPRPLSAIESTVLSRAVAAIAAHLAPVCGVRESLGIEQLSDLVGFMTYFELHALTPVECRIGVALSRDPRPEPHGRLTIDDLSDVPLELSVHLELGRLDAGMLVALEEGAFVPTQRGITGAAGTLRFAGCPITHGECGVNGNHYAFAIGGRLATRGEEP